VIGRPRSRKIRDGGDCVQENPRWPGRNPFGSPQRPGRLSAPRATRSMQGPLPLRAPEAPLWSAPWSIPARPSTTGIDLGCCPSPTGPWSAPRATEETATIAALWPRPRKAGAKRRPPKIDINPSPMFDDPLPPPGLLHVADRPAVRADECARRLVSSTVCHSAAVSTSGASCADVFVAALFTRMSSRPCCFGEARRSRPAAGFLARHVRHRRTRPCRPALLICLLRAAAPLVALRPASTQHRAPPPPRAFRHGRGPDCPPFPTGDDGKRGPDRIGMHSSLSPFRCLFHDNGRRAPAISRRTLEHRSAALVY